MWNHLSNTCSTRSTIPRCVIYIYTYTPLLSSNHRRINDRNVRNVGGIQRARKRFESILSRYPQVQLEARLPRDYCNCTYTSGAIDIQLGARHGNFPLLSRRWSSIVLPPSPQPARILLSTHSIETSTPTRQPKPILFESSVRLNKWERKKIAGQSKEK